MAYEYSYPIGFLILEMTPKVRESNAITRIGFSIELNRSSKLRDNNERKKPIVTRSCVRLIGWFRDLEI